MGRHGMGWFCGRFVEPPEFEGHPYNRHVHMAVEERRTVVQLCKCIAIGCSYTHLEEKLEICVDSCIRTASVNKYGTPTWPRSRTQTLPAFPVPRLVETRPGANANGPTHHP